MDRHAHRAGHSGGRDRSRTVEEPRHRYRRAGQGAARAVRRRTRVPSARRHPRRHTGADRAVPGRHRPPIRQPVPGHRTHLVLRRGQHPDRRTLPRTDHLRPPQAGRPRRPGARPGREAAAVRGGQARRDVRAALRRARHAAAAGDPRATGPGHLHRRRAGPLPRRAGHPAAHRCPHRRLLRRLRSAPGPALALLTPRHRQTEQITMKLALDPYMLRSTPLLQLPAVVAELGYEYIELSPREDFMPFFLHPRVADATVAAFTRERDAAGVKIASNLPLYRWSGPDEDERQAAVRYWKRAIQITTQLDCAVMNSEF